LLGLIKFDLLEPKGVILARSEAFSVKTLTTKLAEQSLHFTMIFGIDYRKYD